MNKHKKRTVEQIADEIHELITICDADTLSNIYLSVFHNIKSCQHKEGDDYTDEYFIIEYK